jgi:hypothetical protein
LQRCLVCGKPLKDEESISRKIGPTCWELVIKIAKEEKAHRKVKQRLKALENNGQVNFFKIIGEGD